MSWAYKQSQPFLKAVSVLLRVAKQHVHFKINNQNTESVPLYNPSYAYIQLTWNKAALYRH